MFTVEAFRISLDQGVNCVEKLRVWEAVIAVPLSCLQTGQYEGIKPESGGKGAHSLKLISVQGTAR